MFFTEQDATGRLRPFWADDSHLYTRYEVTLVFIDRVYGGVPRDPNLIAAWLKDRIMGPEIELRRHLLQILAEQGVELPEAATPAQIEHAIDQVAELKGNTFRRDGHALCLMDYQIKAMLKEATAIAFPWDRHNRWGPTRKAPRAAIAEWVFVDGRRHPLYHRQPYEERGELIPVTQPDGWETRVGHVQGPRGARSTLTIVDYCVQPVMRFRLGSFRDQITPEQWRDILLVGQRLGLGAIRSMSEGQFCVVDFQRIGPVAQAACDPEAVQAEQAALEQRYRFRERFTKTRGTIDERRAAAATATCAGEDDGGQ